jgi:hypothetical protein
MYHLINVLFHYFFFLCLYGSTEEALLSSIGKTFVLKVSRAISHVNVELKTNVSEISSTLMMDTEEISETLVFSSTLTQLIC